MKKLSWSLVLGTSLFLASILCYLAQILIFHESRNTFFYMLQDFAFLPIQVLLVTLILSQLLARREKAALQRKMNMAIGVFFSEVGNDLLRLLSGLSTNIDEIHGIASVGTNWTDKDFLNAKLYLSKLDFSFALQSNDLNLLKSFLVDKRVFMLSLLKNPNLLEHESFTELLWAVFHLNEELAHRADVRNLSDIDTNHITGDIKRAYPLLIMEWLSYAKHLKDEYPYIFSLIIRLSPFDLHPSAEIKETVK